jgi:hypothetical protein
MTTINTSINKLTVDSTEQTQDEYRKQKGREAQLRYRQKNREKLNTASKAYNSQPFTCVICNRTMLRGTRNRHLKTKAHIALVCREIENK